MNTGKGQLIELSMQEAMTYYLRTATSGGNYGERAAARHGNGATPNMSLYRCKGDGANDYVYIMAVTPRMWQQLCHAIGREDLLKDPRVRGPRANATNGATKVKSEIEAWTRQRDKYEAMRTLAEGGVPASAVLDTSDLLYNPHLLERGFVHEVQHAEVGKIRAARLAGAGCPPAMCRSRPRRCWGEHSREVVAADLGLSDSAVGRFWVAKGVIGAA